MAAANDTNSRTALEIAVRAGRHETVKELLEDGGDANQTSLDDEDVPMLFLAHDPEVVSLLLQHGADVHYFDDIFRTALHCAVVLGLTEVVKILLQYGANVNVIDISGWTPVLIAIQNGCKEILPLLMERGANLHQKCHSGWTALSGALVKMPCLQCYGTDPAASDWQTVRFLLEHNVSIGDALSAVLSWKNASILRWLESHKEKTILSIRTLQTVHENGPVGSEENPHKNVQLCWNMTCCLLWLNLHGTNRMEDFPLIQHTRDLSDQDFKAKYKWMIGSLSSLLFVDKSHELLRQLCRVFDEDLALQPCLFTGKTPWRTALDLFPKWNDSEEAVQSLEFLLLEWNPKALQQRDANRRIPLACAIQKGVPFATIEKLVRGWRPSTLVRDPVTGLYTYMSVAIDKNYYSVSDFFAISRNSLPNDLDTARKDPN